MSTMSQLIESIRANAGLTEVKRMKRITDEQPRKKLKWTKEEQSGLGVSGRRHYKRVASSDQFDFEVSPSGLMMGGLNVGSKGGVGTRWSLFVRNRGGRLTLPIFSADRAVFRTIEDAKGAAERFAHKVEVLGQENKYADWK